MEREGEQSAGLHRPEPDVGQGHQECRKDGRLPWRSLDRRQRGDGTHAVLGEAARDTLVKNIRLAEQSGAETVTLSGDDVTDEILSYARSHAVTRIVIGKSGERRWASLLRGTIVDRLLRVERRHRHLRGAGRRRTGGLPVAGRPAAAAMARLPWRVGRGDRRLPGRAGASGGRALGGEQGGRLHPRSRRRCHVVGIGPGHTRRHPLGAVFRLLLRSAVLHARRPGHRIRRHPAGPRRGRAPRGDAGGPVAKTGRDGEEARTAARGAVPSQQGALGGVGRAPAGPGRRARAVEHLRQQKSRSVCLDPMPSTKRRRGPSSTASWRERDRERS